MLHRVATSSCRGHVDELATEPFLLLHREHGTGYQWSWNCCDRRTCFVVIWKHFCFILSTGTRIRIDSRYGLTLWCALGLLVGGAIHVPQLQLQLQLCLSCSLVSVLCRFVGVCSKLLVCTRGNCSCQIELTEYFILTAFHTLSTPAFSTRAICSCIFSAPINTTLCPAFLRKFVCQPLCCVPLQIQTFYQNLVLVAEYHVWLKSCTSLMIAQHTHMDFLVLELSA